MVQGAPLPPTPVPPGLDPNIALIQVLDWVGPIAVLLVVAIGLRWLFKTPVGEAIAEQIRHGWRRRGVVTGETTEQVVALEAQVASLRTEVSELAERLDFAERILAKHSEPRLGQGR